MRIHRLRLRNFRGITEQEIEPAQEGVTIVQGPNESGKSTLLEAVDLVFRRKDNSRAQEVRSVQPVGEDVGPEVELEVETGPYRFTYFKRFIRDKETTLEVHEPSRESYSGDKAHERAQAILEETLDTALWRALRVDQGTGIEQVDLEDQSALSKALDQAAGSALVGDQEIDIFQAVREEYLEHWTKTGNLRKDARQVRNEARELADKVGELEEGLQELQDDVQRVETLEDELEEKRDALAEARQDREDWEDRWQSVQSLQETVDEKREDRDVAQERLQRARERLDRREELRTKVHDLKDELEDHEERLEAHEPEVEALQTQASGLEKAAEAADEALEELRGHLAQRREDEQLLRKRDELEDLRGRVRRAEDAQETIEEAEAVLDELSVDESTLEAIREARYDLRSKQDRLKEGGPRIQASLEASAEALLDEEQRSLAPGDEVDERIRDTFTLQVDEVLDLTVEAGRSAGDLEEAVEEAREEYGALLEEVGVDELDEAEDAFSERTEAQRKRDSARERLEDHLDGETVSRLRSRLEELEDEVDSLSADRETDLALPETVSEAERLRQRAERWADRAETARESTERELEEARRRRDEVVAEHEDLDREHELLEQRLKTARTELEEARQETPDTQLQEAVNDAEDALEEAESALEEAKTSLEEENPDEVRTRYENAEQVVTRLDDEISELETELTDLRARISERGGDGLHEEFEETRRQHEQARRDWERYKRRIDALKLLHDTLAEEREKAKKLYVQPLKKRIDGLGQVVFGDDFEVELGEDLSIEERVLDGTPLDWDDLSGGAKEQLNLLTRLAAGRIVSEGEEPGAPLFVDDALGYTDPDRLDAMNAVLGTASEDLQVLVLTCYPERYQGVGGAKVVRMD